MFDGIDKFYEPYHGDPLRTQNSNVAFWLPKYFPDRVRIIATCEEGNETFDYFKKLECPILELNGDAKVSDFMQRYYAKRSLFVVFISYYLFF